MYARLRRYAGIGLVVLLAAGVVAFFVSGKLQGVYILLRACESRFPRDVETTFQTQARYLCAWWTPGTWHGLGDTIDRLSRSHWPHHPVLMTTLSTTWVKVWLGESLPICTVARPAVPRLPVVVW